jgi:hypothetical protein
MINTRVYLKTAKINGSMTDIAYLKAIHESFGTFSALVTNFDYRPSDLAVIHAYVNQKVSDMKMSEVESIVRKVEKGCFVCFRRIIAENQLQRNKNVLISDANFFKYKQSRTERSPYLRFSLNGIDPTTGYYFDNTIDPTRWKKISKDHDISLKDWRKTGNHILILLQRHNGWTMGNVDSIEWCKAVIGEIKKYSDRNIIIRKHPREKYKGFLEKLSSLETSRVKISNNEHILQDLENAWCSVTYNSSPGVISAVEGIPTFVLDPIAKSSHAYQVANLDIQNIENPFLSDERQVWIERISMSLYNIQDIQKGLLRDKIQEYIIK